jgi:hypothetical protein
MSRHVVLLRRDPPLGLALRALLHGTGRVTEIQNIAAWSAVADNPVDAVVVDLPYSRRTQAIEEVRRRFFGPLVVVIDPIDDATEISAEYRCWILQRPFEIADLWRLIITDSIPPSPTESSQHKGEGPEQVLFRPQLDSRIPSTLRVFLCHSSHDKPVVRSLYFRLRENGVYPWLDEVNILPGQDWEQEIEIGIRQSHVVLVCLSKSSIDKVGYVQKEIGSVLDLSDQQPEGTIFLIPVRLEKCEVPNRLRKFQWVDLYDRNGFERLLLALVRRAEDLE